MLILLPNPQPQNDRLAALFVARGAAVVQLPLHHITPPPDDGAALHEFIETVELYDWIIVTSAHSARVVVDHLRWRVRQVGPLSFAAVGQCTADILIAADLTVALIGDSGGAALVDSLLTARSRPSQIAVLRASAGHDDWHDALRSAGVRVTAIDTHALLPSAIDGAAWCDEHAQKKIDALIFTAPSAVIQFAKLFPAWTAEKIFSAARCVAIGHTTAEAIEQVMHVTPTIAATPCYEALVECVIP